MTKYPQNIQIENEAKITRYCEKCGRLMLHYEFARFAKFEPTEPMIEIGNYHLCEACHFVDNGHDLPF